MNWMVKRDYNNEIKEDSWLTNYTNRFWDNMDVFFGDAKYTDDDENLIYEIEIPGFNKSNIEISVANGMLTVKGRRETRSKSHAGQKELYKRINIGTQEVDAEIKDGILYLTLKNPYSEKKVVEVK